MIIINFLCECRWHVLTLLRPIFVHLLFVGVYTKCTYVAHLFNKLYQHLFGMLYIHFDFSATSPRRHCSTLSHLHRPTAHHPTPVARQTTGNESFRRFSVGQELRIVVFAVRLLILPLFSKYPPLLNRRDFNYISERF